MNDVAGGAGCEHRPSVFADPSDFGPACFAAPGEELTVVLPSLALGGAERIVLDWIARVRSRHAVHLVALRASVHEHAVPVRVRLTRCNGTAAAGLSALGKRLAVSRNRLVLCHLLTAAQRASLRTAGAHPVPVLHNARAGWIGTPQELLSEPHLIVVAQAIADELRVIGYRGMITVIRHLPSMPALPQGLREQWRRRWGIAHDAVVLGMIGGVKPQKAYPRALRVFRDYQRRDPAARLVILGGPAGRDGPLAWDALLAQRARLGLENHVMLPGYVADAARALPAIDVLLNTSTHEGLSMATLEALQAGVPVVASRVGGQGEIDDAKLFLLPPDVGDEAWTAAIQEALGAQREPAAWRDFPAYRLWTLAHLAAPYAARAHVLFVTANLNAGGAQRSLVNLAYALRDRLRFTIAVTGGSATAEFVGWLRDPGIDVVRTAPGRDAFDHAEALLRICRERACDTVAFWNLDPKVKLLVTKFTQAWPALRRIDVSPGAYAFEEMSQTQSFQERTAFGADAYYASLAALVHKYGARNPTRVRCATRIIPNGVRQPARVMTDYRCGPIQCIVVSGRIAPSKFSVETVDAIGLLRMRIPRVELHFYGSIEPRHRAYGELLFERVRRMAGTAVHFQGADARAPELLHAYDVALVLGEHQGCPNACLEALAAGVPLVANDSGGTRELVLRGRTGWLLDSTHPAEIAQALFAALTQRARAERFARAGQR
ncbi:MAG: glycosyltransferase, partial [Betaproteobacteria bacterium]